jgi:hypothetical protein
MSGGLALLQTLSPFQQAGCGQGPAVAIEGLVPEEEEEVVLSHHGLQGAEDVEAVQLHQQGAIAGWLTVEDGGLPGDGAVSGEDQRLVARRATGNIPGEDGPVQGGTAQLLPLQHIECPRIGGGGDEVAQGQLLILAAAHGEGRAALTRD